MTLQPNQPADKSKTLPLADGRREPILFMVLAGAFLFIAIIKFGNPVILDNEVFSPQNLSDAIVSSWKLKWGYLLLIPVVAAGVFAIRVSPLPRKWLFLLPLLWLGWQFISATGTVSPTLTGPTLAHFSTCAVFYYLGFFALRGVRNPWPIWVGLALALCWTMHSALDQHFGGLAATRQMAQEGNGLGLPPAILNNPDYVKRMSSDRVFGTFLYPNSLAGGILLLLPVTLVFVWQITPKLRPLFRWLFVLILGGCGFSCLYWSGSKAAWLLMVISGVIALASSPISISWKRALIYGLLAVGLVGFTIKYVDSVVRGKTSMVARFAYWKGAVDIFLRHPIIGTGPGTFGVEYEQIKSKDAEMARLAHNDYLEQASDSGVFGFLTFSTLILGSLFMVYRYRLSKNDPFFTIKFAAWLGLVGLFLHSTMEFHLYYPALAWPAFLLLGWLSSSD
jgi:O-antigen ligase